MKDVAHAAGVSVKTVSRVVNEERWVSSDIETKVQRAISELGYRPDDRARGLRTPGVGTSTIGFIHADMANPFFTAVHSGLEAVASEHNLLILTGSSGESTERQDALVHAFSGRRVDGLVVVPTGSTDLANAASNPTASSLQAEIDRGTPVVFIDREPSVAGDFVTSDHYGGAVQATRHLISMGHRKIAFIGDDEHLYSAAERRRGFVDTMAACQHCSPWIRSGGTVEESEALVHQMLQSPDAPSAIFAAQNYMTIGAIKALHTTGRQRDIALVGFDQVEMGDVIEPGITVIPQDAPALGREAGRLLLERLTGARTEVVRTVLPVDLIPRGSGEIPG